MKENYKHWLVIFAALYGLFVVYDSWRAYRTPTAVASKFNVFAKLINWKVQAAASPDSQPNGAGNDWSFATDYVKGGAV